MVRAMTKPDFGTLNLLYSIIPVINTIASLGLEQTLRRYQPEYLQAGKSGNALWLVRLVSRTRFATNILFVGAILLCWNLVAPIFDLAPFKIEFAIFGVLILLFFQSRILQISLAAHMMHRVSVGSMAIIAAIKLVAYCMLAWKYELTIQTAIWSDIAAFGVAYVFLLVVYRRHCQKTGFITPEAPEKQERRRLLKYGVFNNFNDAGALVLMSRSDNFFIAAIMDTISVGVYSFYTRLNSMALHVLPVNQFDNVIQPVFFSIKTVDADSKIPKYFSLLINVNLMFQLPILAAAISFHSELVQVVFGGKFIEQSWLLPVMVAFSTFNVVGTPVTLVAQYEEKAGIILASKIFGAYNIVALLALVPLLGVYGAAIASGTAQAMKNLFVWWHVRKRAVWQHGVKVLVGSAIIWTTCIVTCRWIAGQCPESPVLTMTAGCVLIGAAALLSTRGPGLTTENRALMSEILRGREAKWLRIAGIIH
jgi:O-antigen/teichoic acid export membrane protein